VFLSRFWVSKWHPKFWKPRYGFALYWSKMIWGKHVFLNVTIATDGCNVVGRQFLAQKLEGTIYKFGICSLSCAPLQPLTILPQICTVWGTKLQKHFNAIVEVFYCFTVSIRLPGDESDCNEDKRSAVAGRMQNKVVVEWGNSES